MNEWNVLSLDLSIDSYVYIYTRMRTNYVTNEANKHEIHGAEFIILSNDETLSLLERVIWMSSKKFSKGVELSNIGVGNQLIR